MGHHPVYGHQGATRFACGGCVELYVPQAIQPRDEYDDWFLGSPTADCKPRRILLHGLRCFSTVVCCLPVLILWDNRAWLHFPSLYCCYFLRCPTAGSRHHRRIPGAHALSDDGTAHLCRARAGWLPGGSTNMTTGEA